VSKIQYICSLPAISHKARHCSYYWEERVIAIALIIDGITRTAGSFASSDWHCLTNQKRIGTRWLYELRYTRGEGLVWFIGAVVCLLAACRGSNCTSTRAMDGRNLHCSTIGSCQSTATSYDCTARLVAALPLYISSAIEESDLYPFYLYTTSPCVVSSASARFPAQDQQLNSNSLPADLRGIHETAAFRRLSWFIYRPIRQRRGISISEKLADRCHATVCL